MSPRVERAIEPPTYEADSDKTVSLNAKGEFLGATTDKIVEKVRSSSFYPLSLQSSFSLFSFSLHPSPSFFSIFSPSLFPFTSFPFSSPLFPLPIGDRGNDRREENCTPPQFPYFHLTRGPVEEASCETCPSQGQQISRGYC